MLEISISTESEGKGLKPANLIVEEVKDAPTTILGILHLVIYRHDHKPFFFAGESPVWLTCKKVLIYIDITGKRIICYYPASGKKEIVELNKLVGFAIPTVETKAEGDIFLAVGLDDCIIELNFSKKVITRVLAEIDDKNVSENCRFNDAKCSPDGTLFAGTTKFLFRPS